jgi:iron complex transport system ATP-binding protein
MELTSPAGEEQERAARAAPIIEFRHVSSYRGQTLVFRDLTLIIPRGEHTVILGPNGAGKTTLMKLLSREIYPLAEGESLIRVFGRDRWNVWDLRAHLGIVSHDLQHDYLECAKGINVILSGCYSSIDTWQHQHFSPEELDRAEKVLRQLDIQALRDRQFGSMSTGQQRRFLLGRALINSPEVLLLDEPTTGLDLRSTFQYLDIVRGLMRNGTTLILVTHHLHEIPPEVHRVVLIKEGRIVADGVKSDVLTSRTLSELFDYDLEVVVSANGYYQVMPSAQEQPVS